VKASKLPVDATSLIYGLTFQADSTNCRDFEFLILCASNDLITSNRYLKCIWGFSGVATIAQYDKVVLGSSGAA
jgi:hypothetical protein